MKKVTKKISEKDSASLEEKMRRKATVYSTFAEIVESAQFPMNNDFYCVESYNTDIQRIKSLYDEFILESGEDAALAERRMSTIADLTEAVGNKAPWLK